MKLFTKMPSASPTLVFRRSVYTKCSKDQQNAFATPKNKLSKWHLSKTQAHLNQ